MSRLVVVFGYSDRSAVELHPVCAVRLARAHAEARPDDIVLFSGWARRGLPAAEADLMASSWTAPIRSRLVDRSAALLVRASLRGSGTSARVVVADEPAAVPSALRELAAWAVAPALALVAARTR